MRYNRGLARKGLSPVSSGTEMKAAEGKRKMKETITTESGPELQIEKRLVDESVEIAIVMGNQRECVLHWGFRDRFLPQWQLPPESLWPQDTRIFDKGAVQTPFKIRDGSGEITIKVDRSVAAPLITFVLFFPEERRWDNNRGRNYLIEIPGRDSGEGHDKSLGEPGLIGMAGEIIEKEMSRNSWTLMHRFNLCYDLLDRIGPGNINGLALIFVWLRFSFTRQLDWQRNYNTKPRELGHAMDRLTLKLADRYSREPGDRSLIRLIMTTLGPGGDAQRVRDEVLHIMHRHHIKEVSGHFMEEWHQKLHNNATADDIVICEAFIEFYRSNGDLGRFYRRIEEGGLSKERLESYERPIRSHPDFIPYLKEALIRDLEHFLGILKEVHAGTDLGVAIYRARYLFDGEMHGLMDFLWHNRNSRDSGVTTLAQRVIDGRHWIAWRFTDRQNVVRDLLFLDLALEDLLRGAIERNLEAPFGEDQLTELIVAGLKNVCLSDGDEELNLCLAHWRQVRQVPRHQETWILQVKAAIDRLQLALGAYIDGTYRLLQPKAEFLGSAFQAASWSISFFSEEVVRGRPAFALSALLKKLDGRVRELAHLGDWQVISRGEGTGEVLGVTSLKSVQGRSFDRSTVIIADEVGGDEEIPKGVTAIITPSVVDVLSHLAIRARNGGIIFATCYDGETLKRLKSSSRYLKVKTTATGEVVFEEVSADAVSEGPAAGPLHRVSAIPPFSAYALRMGDWNERNTGGKSNNLKRMTGRLPEWIHLPASAALPFGVFERILADERNRESAARYHELVDRLEREPQNLGPLGDLRSTALNLAPPPELPSSLRTVMREGMGSGLPLCD
ncbi:MAG TPA: hypothetical protein VLD40_03155 [Dissulfurispiraceae bacterium]|nr:hypothetical protein [Dissulfurispiraceae bacterium]